VHVATNELVKAAKEHQARVVLEELTIQRRTRALPKGRKGGRFGRAARRILGRQQYAKLVKALTYKLRVAGLPPPVEIGAAFTSQTCPECGHRDPANRPKEKLPGSDLVIMDRFRCTRCGHAADADRNAARVIALKGAWFTQLPTKTERGGRPLREDEKFDQYLLDAIRRRGSSGAQPVPS
jgi:IS605 OrfB family transposase